jgi:S1-C subfamily serine protease
MRTARCFLLTSILCIAWVPATAQETKPPQDVFESSLGVRGQWVAQIAAVQEGSVAQQLGLTPGNLIVGFNGQVIREFGSFRDFLAKMREAALRDKAVMDVLKCGPLSDSYHSESIVATLTPTDNSSSRLLGFKSTLAFLVQDVLPGSPAQRMGISRGEFIDQINGQVIGNMDGPVAVDSLLEQISATPTREILLTLIQWRSVGDHIRVGKDAKKVKGTLSSSSEPR